MAITILLIEDHEDSRRIYREVLTFAGYEVIEAEEGLAGIRLYREALPDVVLLDVSLPKASGYDVLQEIGGEARLRAVPIVCISANAFQHNRDRALDLGASLYLIKPLGPRELLSELEALLGGDSGSSGKSTDSGP